MMNSHIIGLVLAIILPFVFFSPASSQDHKKTIKALPVPTLGYSPETKAYFGAVTLFTIDFYKDSTTRVSNAKIEFNYTWNRQLILEKVWNCFLKNERWFTNGRLHYSNFPDYYYGVGIHAPESDKLLYTSKRYMFEGSMLKNLAGQVFLGPSLRFMDYTDIHFNEGPYFQELSGRTSMGLGLQLLVDSRNNLITPSRGYYLNLSTSYAISKQDYIKASIDSRFYKTWGMSLTWANRLINELNIGDVPFYDYSFMGGDRFVRGYQYGRFRDKGLASFQTEFRLPIIWRFGLASFGGISNLYGEKFNFTNLKGNYGAGLRFLVDNQNKTNLRIDYAIGEGGNKGFYISFGESF